ncbi:hypothetical protein [Paludibaculum fermentans]|uniref:Uncharacterized protein n=1 Tax=Paludibaculum fermentans TaxID=1473598 RepID=A0A7S7NM71_PALFE|nr:hypothetical protein [Paludibaculum fermentans]QOY86216.1 hypothetical protein IRI77_25855 [Paludibaculum fermentans]
MGDRKMNFAECTQCTKNNREDGLPPPCFRAAEAAASRNRPQMVAVKPTRLGSPCPMSADWDDLIAVLMSRKAYDVNQEGKSRLYTIKSELDRYPRGTNFTKSEANRKTIGAAVGYVATAARGGGELWLSYSKDYPTLGFVRGLPSDSVWAQVLENYYRDVGIDPARTYVGGAVKLALTPGIYPEGVDGVAGVVMNLKTMKRFAVTATVKKVAGGGGVSSAVQVVVASNVAEPAKLKGMKFKGGFDINVTVGLKNWAKAAGAVKDAKKLGVLVKIAQALHNSKGIVKIDSMGDVMAAVKALIAGNGGLTTYRSGQPDFIVADLPLLPSVGFELSLTFQSETTITSVKPL